MLAKTVMNSNTSGPSASSRDSPPILILPKTLQWLSQGLRLNNFPFYCSISTWNTVRYDSAIHIAIMKGNIKKIRRLLCSSSASIRDVDPSGLNLLFVGTFLSDFLNLSKMTVSMQRITSGCLWGETAQSILLKSSWSWALMEN